MRVVEMTNDEMMVTLDALNVLRASYENVRGYSPDYAEDWMLVIEGLLNKIKPMVKED
jgi:hypothetical protein